MKRTTTFVLFASIFAVAAGTLGFSLNSETPVMSSVSASEPQAVQLLGHVEYKVLDESGKIVQYLQGDNEVVNGGEDCVAFLLFGVETCENTNTGAFSYIGIGNGTADVGPLNATLADGTNNNDVSDCAYTTGGPGELARRSVTPTLTSAAADATGAIIELETTKPFTFDAGNATTVRDSGIFNDARAHNSQNECNANETAETGGSWDMFSRQLLNGATGIVVSDGDSLSVKWTITVG